jgi:integrase
MESQKKNTPTFRPNPGLTLRAQVRKVRRSSHDAYRTAQTAGHGLRRDLHCCGGKTPPNRIGATEVAGLLSYRATAGRVGASTQRQALNALAFLYRDVLHTPLASPIAPVRGTRHPRLPPVLTQTEGRQLIAAMTGRHALMARRLDGGGLRLLACPRLRLQDVDFGQHLIVVRGGKGGRERTTNTAGYGPNAHCAARLAGRVSLVPRPSSRASRIASGDLLPDADRRLR